MPWVKIGAVVVRLEASLDVLGFVGEVQHHGLFLARMDAVEPRQGLHR